MWSPVSNMVAELERSNQLQKAHRSAGEPHIQTCGARSLCEEMAQKTVEAPQFQPNSAAVANQAWTKQQGRSSANRVLGERLNCFETNLTVTREVIQDKRHSHVSKVVLLTQALQSSLAPSCVATFKVGMTLGRPTPVNND